MKKSKLGYKRYSPDVNNPYNVIPSGRITMKDVDFPVFGIDNLGNRQMMYPGREYQFPGNQVFELPMAQKGKQVPNRYWFGKTQSYNSYGEKDSSGDILKIPVDFSQLRGFTSKGANDKNYFNITPNKQFYNAASEALQDQLGVSFSPKDVKRNVEGFKKNKGPLQISAGDQLTPILNPRDLSFASLSNSYYSNPYDQRLTESYLNTDPESLQKTLNSLGTESDIIDLVQSYDASIPVLRYMPKYNSLSLNSERVFRRSPFESNIINYVGSDPYLERLAGNNYNNEIDIDRWSTDKDYRASYAKRFVSENPSYLDQYYNSITDAVEKDPGMVDTMPNLTKNASVSFDDHQGPGVNNMTYNRFMFADAWNDPEKREDELWHRFRTDFFGNALKQSNFNYEEASKLFEPGQMYGRDNALFKGISETTIPGSPIDIMAHEFGHKYSTGPKINLTQNYNSESYPASLATKDYEMLWGMSQETGSTPFYSFQDHLDNGLDPDSYVKTLKSRVNSAADELNTTYHSISPEETKADVYGIRNYLLRTQGQNYGEPFTRKNYESLMQDEKFKQSLLYERMMKRYGNDANKWMKAMNLIAANNSNSELPMAQTGGEKTIELKEAEIIHKMTLRELIDAARFQWDDDINQTRLFERSKDFLQGWQNSPMYLKMLTKSAPEDWIDFDVNRIQQLVDAPKLNVNRFDSPSSAYGAYSPAFHDVVLNRRAFPSNSTDQDFMDTYVHELTHATDVKRGDILLTKPFIWKWEMSMPEADVKLMKKLISPEFRDDEYASNPTEIRARINAARQQAKDAGIYDPYTEKFTRKTLKKLLELNADSPTVRGIEDLNVLFPKANDLIKIMNSVSDNSSGQDIPMAQLGGMRKKKVDRILNDNRDLNFVQRMYQPGTPSIMIPGQNGPSTHFMESADGFVYPTVVQMPDGNLQYLGEGAYDHAMQTGEYIQFSNDRQARRFAKSYKKGTDVLKEYQTDGQYYSGGEMIRRAAEGGESQKCPPGYYWDSITKNCTNAHNSTEVPDRIMYWSNPDDAEWFNSHAVFSPEGPGKHDDQVRQMVRLGHGYNPSTGTIHFSKNPVPINEETRYYDDLGAIQRFKAEYAEEKRQQQKEWNNARKPVLISNEEWWNPNFNFETFSGTRNARDFAGQTVYMTPEEFNAYNRETVRNNMERIHKESAIWTLPGTIATSAFAPSMFVPSAMYHTAEGIKEEDYLKAGLNSLMVIPAVKAVAGPAANTVRQGAKYAGNALLNTADRFDRALMYAQPSRIRDAAYAYNSGSRVLSPNELRVLQKYGNIHAPEIYNPVGKNYSYVNHLQRGLFGTRDAMGRPANLTTLDRYKNFNPWKSERWDPSIGRDFMRQDLNAALQTRFDRAGVRISDLPSGSSISSATYVEPIGANVARQNFNGQFSMNPPRFWSDENIRNSILNYERNIAIHEPINTSNTYLNPIRNRVAGYDPLFDVRRYFGAGAKTATHRYGDFGQSDYQTAFPRRTTTEGPGRINNFTLHPELSGVAEENIARLDYSDRILGRLNRNYRMDLKEGFTNLERPFLENPSLIPTIRPVGSRGMHNWPDTRSYRSERFTPSGVHPSYNQNFRPQVTGMVEDPTTGKLIPQYSTPRTTRMRRGTGNILASNQIQFPQHSNINGILNTDFKVPGRTDRISQVSDEEVEKALRQISSDVPIDQYVFEFNDNLDELNRIIKANNKSGWDWKVNRLTNDGMLEISYPAQNWKGVPVDAGTRRWAVNIKPGRLSGNVELVPNMSYYYRLPGLNMSNTSQSVFPRDLMRARSTGAGPIEVPQGTGAYNSINQYLKDFNLGRVKPGFNSQSVDSYSVWKKYIKEGKAFGFEPRENLIYGAMKRKGGQTLPKAQFGFNALTPIVAPFMAAYDAGVAAKDWFSDVFSNESKPEVTTPVKEEKPVDWTTLSRPDQINYGINEVLKYDAPEKRQAVENLLRATAYMENTYGADPNAYGRDYTNSFMSIDPIALTDLFTGRGYKGAYNSSQQNYLKSMEALGLPADKDQYKDLLQEDNPVAAMMAARARYALVPEPLPSANDIEGMFNYWLKYYNGNGVLKHKTRQQAFNDFAKGYRSVIGGN